MPEPRAMESPTDMESPVGDEQASSLTARAGALLQRVEESARRGRRLVGAVTELASLEARLAALSLMEMQGLALVAALLAFSSWGLLLALMVMMLAQWTVLGWPGALLLAALINAGAVWLVVRRLRRLSANLSFGATRAILFPPEPTPESGLHEAADDPRSPIA